MPMWWISLAACRHDAPETVSSSPSSTTDPNTWSGEGPLAADTTVAAGTAVTIERGTTVTLAEGVALIVDGELDAQGAPDSPITFTGDAVAPWRSIVFDDGATDATFEGVDVYQSGSIVENAVIEHAT